MRKSVSLMRSFTKGFFLPVSLVLVAQAAAIHMLSIPERDLPIPGLHKLPFELGEWRATGEQSLEADVAEYLRPDEYIIRNYVAEHRAASINVFVAHFKSLQDNYGPHSPRICLPGSGWLVRSSKITNLQVPGRAGGIPVNEYVLEKSGESILVLYWYQNNRNVWAEEFQAKLTMLPDLIRYRRSDVSLVRLISPMRANTPETELAKSVEFTNLLFPLLVERFATTD